MDPNLVRALWEALDYDFPKLRLPNGQTVELQTVSPNLDLEVASEQKGFTSEELQRKLLEVPCKTLHILHSQSNEDQAYLCNTLENASYLEIFKCINTFGDDEFEGEAAYFGNADLGYMIISKNGLDLEESDESSEEEVKARKSSSHHTSKSVVKSTPSGSKSGSKLRNKK